MNRYKVNATIVDAKQWEAVLGGSVSAPWQLTTEGEPDTPLPAGPVLELADKTLRAMHFSGVPTIWPQTASLDVDV